MVDKADSELNVSSGWKKQWEVIFQMGGNLVWKGFDLISAWVEEIWSKSDGGGGWIDKYDDDNMYSKQNT